MNLCGCIINIILLLCSVFASILSCWPMLRDLSSLSTKQMWMLALDFFTSFCWMWYSLNQHPVSLFLIVCDISSTISQLLCFITFVYYRYRGCQSACLEFHTIMALGTPPLVFIAVSMLWIFDVSGICFAIFAILAGISSSILSLVQSINSAVVFIFGFVQLGVAFFAHEIHGAPWFFGGTSDSLPSESEEPSGSQVSIVLLETGSDDADCSD